MKKIGREIDARDFWDHKYTRNYIAVSENAYHKHRLAVINDLIPSSLKRRGRSVFDFGCGDATLFPPFLKAGARIEGTDVSDDMINVARGRLASEGYDPELVRKASVGYLGRLPSASFDAVFSFNVLAYLSAKEEKVFYREASRIIKPGGFLVVTHSNELFDMFSLNRHTVEFFKRHLLAEPSKAKDLKKLLSVAHLPKAPTTIYNIRENPLAYKYKLARYGFREVRQAFIHLHEAPPSLLKKKKYSNTLGFREEEQWKLMFTCSMFGSCSVRESHEAKS